jgi:AraC family transcriptional regulator, transcriptional activator FtrA
MNQDSPLVVALAYDGLCTFEFGIVVEVFGLARPEFDFPWYEFKVCAREAGGIAAVGGFSMSAPHDLGLLDRADIIIIPGWRSPADLPARDVVDAILRAHRRGARLVSICGGVFVLAATGLLDNRRATTHWLYADELAARYPAIIVDPEVLYTEDDTIFTSAGSAAGIDLCLHIVRKDYGSHVANSVARRLIAPPYREGGQSQFILSRAPKSGGAHLAEVLDWLRGNLRDRVTITDIARKARMSERTLLRRFKMTTGTTPLEWLIQQRVLFAQLLLETGNYSVEQVSTESGFGSAEAFRYHFRRITQTSPTAYRRTFRVAA